MVSLKAGKLAHGCLVMGNLHQDWGERSSLEVICVRYALIHIHLIQLHEWAIVPWATSVPLVRSKTISYEKQKDIFDQLVFTMNIDAMLIMQKWCITIVLKRWLTKA